MSVQSLTDVELVRAYCRAVARYPETKAECTELREEAALRGEARINTAISALSTELEAQFQEAT